uniref:SH3 domain-containing protein n=1 Tax=Periophthalmus magnuspinnatus TaxID=409849 RepID=A0A3B4B1L3_9GOBI
MGDSELRLCPCLSSLWDRLKGHKNTEGTSNQVVLSPVLVSSVYGSSQAEARYVALSDFVAGQEDEMSFQQGDRFKMLGHTGEWWTVQKMDESGQARGTGNVPFKYLERVELLYFLNYK